MTPTAELVQTLRHAKATLEEFNATEWPQLAEIATRLERYEGALQKIQQGTDSISIVGRSCGLIAQKALQGD